MHSHSRACIRNVDWTVATILFRPQCVKLWKELCTGKRYSRCAETRITIIPCEMTSKFCVIITAYRRFAFPRAIFIPNINYFKFALSRTHDTWPIPRPVSQNLPSVILLHLIAYPPFANSAQRVFQSRSGSCPLTIYFTILQCDFCIFPCPISLPLFIISVSLTYRNAKDICVCRSSDSHKDRLWWI